MELIFEKSVAGRQGFQIPRRDVPVIAAIPDKYKRAKDCQWPEVSELDVVRHFTRLSQLNFSIDTNFYPLGSCTMKYNPKVNAWAASHPHITRIHPLAPDWAIQNLLSMLKELETNLLEITGMDA